MSTATTAPNAPQTPADDDARRDWGLVAFPTYFIGAQDREAAESTAAEYPHLRIVSRVPGEDWPTFNAFDPAFLSPEQRAQLLAELLTDHKARAAAMATLDAHVLHDIAGACDTAVTPMEQASLVNGLRDIVKGIPGEELGSTAPITHVRFGSSEYDNGFFYDEDNARFRHADGTVTTLSVDSTEAAEALTELSELNNDMGYDSLLTVDLTTGALAYTCTDTPGANDF